jgi:peroxiredoxin
MVADRKTARLEDIVGRDSTAQMLECSRPSERFNHEYDFAGIVLRFIRIHQQRMAYVMRNTRSKTVFFAALVCPLFAMCVPAATVQMELKPPPARAEAPSFSLADASGRTEQLADYRGKVVLLNFWATDCGGCRLEIPWLLDIDHNFENKRVSVIGISMDIPYEDLKNAAEAWAKVKPFVEARHITYPILMGDGEVTKRYDIQALPATYLIDSRGRIAAMYVGLIDKRNVKENINTLLAEQK